jgi:hypothetical protein
MCELLCPLIVDPKLADANGLTALEHLLVSFSVVVAWDIPNTSASTANAATGHAFNSSTACVGVAALCDGLRTLVSHGHRLPRPLKPRADLARALHDERVVQAVFNGRLAKRQRLHALRMLMVETAPILSPEVADLIVSFCG